jgi:hypothetical protein
MAGRAADGARAVIDFAPVRPATRDDLHYLRASGLAQARLQLAMLSGNRRRALREIDRLIEIDRQLACIAGSQCPDASTFAAGPIEAHLGRQRQAIATEKLALTAAIEFPRLPRPAEPGELVLEEEQAIAVVEDSAFGRRLARIGLWGFGAAAAALAAAGLAIGLPLLGP